MNNLNWIIITACAFITAHLGVNGARNQQFRRFYRAAVAAPQPCSGIGRNMLLKGGSTVDAAIATALCLGVVNMQSNGIGGGHFMTIYEKPRDGDERQFHTILARERAPLQATEDMYVNGSASSVSGGMAIGVPGEVKGFYTAWQKFGVLPWKDLFAPSIRLAKRGVKVNPDVAHRAALVEAAIRGSPNLSKLLVKADGSLIQEGDVVKNKKLGRTLATTAENPRAFYDPNSQLAKDVVADIQEAGGIISLEDLEQYYVYEKEPEKTHLKNGDLNVYGPPPPSGAVIVQFILNVLDGYHFNKRDLRSKRKQILTYHRIVEAFKFGFAKRTMLGDEDFVDVVELVQNLTCNDYGEEIRAKIVDSQTFDIDYYGPDFVSPEDSGTTHLSVLGPDGSAVALTSTINYLFGSKVLGSRTGIIFNNEMDDFSTPGLINLYGLAPSPSNFIEPGKMPMSSMSPTIVTDKDGNVVLVTGGEGGPKIITGTAYVAAHTLWFNNLLKRATDRPRLHHQLVPNVVAIEDDFDQNIKSGLISKGHELDNFAYNNILSVYSNCQSHQGDDNPIRCRGKCVMAKVDKRKFGRPAGY